LRNIGIGPKKPCQSSSNYDYLKAAFTWPVLRCLVTIYG